MRPLPSAKRLPTLFVADLEGRSPGEIVRLCKAESRHVQALRLSSEALLRLTDGRGAAWEARFAGARADPTALVLLQPLRAARPVPVELSFPVANKAHTLWLVEKMAEFAVEILQPLDFSRSRSVADAARSPSFWQKARNRALAAVKQSGGSWLPQLREVASLEEYLAGSSAVGENPRVVLDRHGPPLWDTLREWSGASRASFIVGPEGGLTEAEQHLIERWGYAKGRLGNAVLRFETAGVAAVAVAAQRWEAVGGEATQRSAATARKGGVQ